MTISVILEGKKVYEKEIRINHKKVSKTLMILALLMVFPSTIPNFPHPVPGFKEVIDTVTRL